MRGFVRLSCAALVVLLTIACVSSQARACTGIRLQAKDGSFVYARTMEFGAPLESKLIIIPRSFSLVGTTSSGQGRLVWKSTYGVVGMNAYNKTAVLDGVNEKGLAGGIFYMPGYAEYQAVNASNESQSLAPWEVITYVLTSFATVEEARAALGEIKVGNVAYQNQGVLPMHFIFHDAKGKSIVVEYIGGALSIHDNPIGVITNAPDFAWHIQNLNNYVGLKANNAAPEEFDGLKIRQFGQGSGLLGMPGDFTPPSRFVRAAILSQSALAGEHGEQTVQQAFHILDSFDIPEGAVRDVEGDRTTYELTQWTTASDLKNCVFYFHSHDNRRIRRFDLLKTNLDSSEVVTLPIGDREDFQDFTRANQE